MKSYPVSCILLALLFSAPLFGEKISTGNTFVSPEELRLNVTGSEFSLRDLYRTIPIDERWRFSGSFAAGKPEFSLYQKPEFNDSRWRIQSTNTPWKNRLRKTAMTAFYRTALFHTPDQLRRILKFNGTTGSLRLYCNGREVRNLSPQTQTASFDLSELLQPGENVLTAELTLSPGKIGQPGKPVLFCTAQQEIQQLEYLQPENRDELTLRYRIINHMDQVKKADLFLQLQPQTDASGRQAVAQRLLSGIELQPGVNAGEITVPLQGGLNWQPDAPHCYYLTLLLKEDQQGIAAKTVPFGWNTTIMSNGYFLLNGQQLTLIGSSEKRDLSRSPGQQLMDLQKCHVNVLEPQAELSEEFFTICDRNGLMVAVPIRNQMELEERLALFGNHPSLVLWIVRGTHQEVNRLTAELRERDPRKRPVAGKMEPGTPQTKLDPAGLPDLLLLSATPGNDLPWTMHHDSQQEQLTEYQNSYRHSSGELIPALMVWPENTEVRTQRRYLAELIAELRFDSTLAGFAPWFGQIDPAWFTPWLLRVTNDAGLPPNHLFQGQASAWTIEVKNETAMPLHDGVCRVFRITSHEGEVELQNDTITELNPNQKLKLPLTLNFLEKNLSPDERATLRIVLENASGHTLFKVDYPLQILSPALRETPLQYRGQVMVWDTGSGENVEATSSLLRRKQLDVKIISSLSALEPGGILIVPQEIVPGRPVEISSPELATWIRTGGTLLMLAQQNLKSTLPAPLRFQVANEVAADFNSAAPVIAHQIQTQDLASWGTPDHGLLARNALFGVEYTDKIIISGTRTELPLLLERRDGRGRYLFCQLDLIDGSRYDGVAARLLHNLLTETLRQESR